MEIRWFAYQGSGIVPLLVIDSSSIAGLDKTSSIIYCKCSIQVIDCVEVSFEVSEIML